MMNMKQERLLREWSDGMAGGDSPSESGAGSQSQ